MKNNNSRRTKINKFELREKTDTKKNEAGFILLKEILTQDSKYVENAIQHMKHDKDVITKSRKYNHISGPPWQYCKKVQIKKDRSDHNQKKHLIWNEPQKKTTLSAKNSRLFKENMRKILKSSDDDFFHKVNDEQEPENQKISHQSMVRNYEKNLRLINETEMALFLMLNQTTNLDVRVRRFNNKRCLLQTTVSTDFCL